MKVISYYENTQSTNQKAFVDLQCNCALCNSPLELKFESINSTEVKEEANCPQCEIRARAKIYQVQ